MADTLTADIAKDLMWRSMTTGAPTSEFDKYGGYSAVADLYSRNGGTYDRSTISSDFLNRAAKTVADTGVGNLGVLADTKTPMSLTGLNAMSKNGVDSSFINKAVNDYGVYGLVSQSQYDNLNKQLTDLTKEFNTLKGQRNSTSNTNNGGAAVAGGTTVSTDSSNFMQNANQNYANSGAVWGPDGRMYSSAAAAVAAGVSNYSTTRPALTSSAANPNTAGGGLIDSALGTSASTKNPFATNGPYSTQVARVGLPGNVTNPFG